MFVLDVYRYGPREVTRREDFSLQGQLYCEVKWATFAKPYRGTFQPSSSERDCSLLLQQCLEPAVKLVTAEITN